MTSKVKHTAPRKKQVPRRAKRSRNDAVVFATALVKHLKHYQIKQAEKIAVRLLSMFAEMQSTSARGSHSSQTAAIAILAQNLILLSRLKNAATEIQLYRAIYRLGDTRLLQSLPIKLLRYDPDGLDELFSTNFYPPLYGTIRVPHVMVKDFCKAHSAFYREFLPQRRITEPKLRFVDPHPPLTSERGSLVVNPFYLAMIKDVTAYSNCNYIWSSQKLISDALSHPRAPDTFDASTIDDKPIVLAIGEKHANIRLPSKKPIDYPRGLMMFGQHAHVYGHWMLEFMPRMLAYDSKYCPDDYPLIVGDNMPQSAIDAMQLLNSRRREIIKLPGNAVVHFASLGVAPVPAFFPLNVWRGPHYDALWPEDVFVDLRKRILAALDKRDVREPQKRRRIFISRKNYAARALMNEKEVAEFLANQGFEIISPELLTFAEQVAVFRSAEIVVVSCSSAAYNCLFCPPDCTIIGLTNDALNFTYRVFASYWRASGAESIFIRGDFVSDDSSGHFMHRNYSIPLEKLKRALMIADRNVGQQKSTGLKRKYA